MQVFLVEVGVLLDKNDPEYTAYKAYDNKFGYYDEDQYYTKDLEKAKRDASKYINNGVAMTYGIISETELPDDINLEDINLEDINVEQEEYNPSCVVWSTYKNETGHIIESFITT